MPAPDETPPPPPAVLDYQRPDANVHLGRPNLSVAAVTAFAFAIAAAVAAITLGRHVFTYRPRVRLEFLAPLIAITGIALSVHALLRIADKKHNLSGDPLAWAALFINTICLLATGCCITLRWLGTLL
jgi:uncharacterized membrane protein YidH (DUF202 family)